MATVTVVMTYEQYLSQLNTLPNETRTLVWLAVQQRLVALDKLWFQREDGVLTEEQHATACELLDHRGSHE